MSGPERRGVILRTATQQFAKSGYKGTNLEEIAELSGVTKPVVYDHFASKEELFLEVLKLIRADLLATAKEALEAEGDTEQRIRAAVLGFFSYAQNNPESMRVLLAMSRGEASLEQAALTIQDEVTSAIVELFGLVLPKKLTPLQKQTFRLQIEFIKQGIHALAEWWPSQPTFTKEQLTDTVMSVAWKGLASMFER